MQPEALGWIQMLTGLGGELALFLFVCSRWAKHSRLLFTLSKRIARLWLPIESKNFPC